MLETAPETSETAEGSPEKPESDALSIPDPSDLPRLNYNLLDHKKKLFTVSALLILECSLLPVALFYGLWYGTTLKHAILFAIITSLFGFITGIEFVHRSWRLILVEDTYRPLGGKRWRFDFTHYALSLAYTYMTVILVGASIPYEPLVRPLAMPAPLFFLQFGIQLLVTGWMSAARKPAPFRISSIPKGERMVPLVFTLVEDIVAVDGGAGKAYRTKLLARYRLSPRFRMLVAQINWFWGIGSFLVGSATLAVMWTVSEEIAYGIGWSVPLNFAILWTVITVPWVRRGLVTEKKLWNSRTS